MAADGIGIRRSLPHGHAVAVPGTLRAIGLDGLLGKPAGQRLAARAIALMWTGSMPRRAKAGVWTEVGVVTSGKL